MYICNIFSIITKLTLKELKKFIFEDYYRQIGIIEDVSYYSMKHKKKLLLLATKLIKQLN